MINKHISVVAVYRCEKCGWYSYTQPGNSKDEWVRCVCGHGYQTHMSSEYSGILRVPEQCSLCIYFSTFMDDLDSGECRRYPPTIGKGWPVIRDLDWCGQFFLCEVELNQRFRSGQVFERVQAYDCPY